MRARRPRRLGSAGGQADPGFAGAGGVVSRGVPREIEHDVGGPGTVEAPRVERPGAADFCPPPLSVVAVPRKRRPGGHAIWIRVPAQVTEIERTEINPASHNTSRAFFRWTVRDKNLARGFSGGKWARPANHAERMPTQGEYVTIDPNFRRAQIMQPCGPYQSAIVAVERIVISGTDSKGRFDLAEVANDLVDLGPEGPMDVQKEQITGDAHEVELGAFFNQPVIPCSFGVEIITVKNAHVELVGGLNGARRRRIRGRAGSQSYSHCLPELPPLPDRGRPGIPVAGWCYDREPCKTYPKNSLN